MLLLQRQQLGDRPYNAGAHFSLLTWNVWSKHDVQVVHRINAIGDVIAEQGYPDFLCFQEMTPLIYMLMSQADWWGQYAASPLPDPEEFGYFTSLLYRTATVMPTDLVHHKVFPTTEMQRNVQMLGVMVGGTAVRIANSHLTSPNPRGDKHSWQRRQECKQGFRWLGACEGFKWLQACEERNILWAGDMNWLQQDGQVPLPNAWCDPWMVLRPTEAGFTYDGRDNPMLGNNSYRSRLDRIFCKLKDWRPASIQRVGMTALPGVAYEKPTCNGPVTLPVLPSDHFGVLVRLARVKPASSRTHDQLLSIKCG
ncbi:hypothetical protein WJX72_003887 [[Myrmecia] bisecta]|uniref:Endonuclease/exonuclease/phosphatase domain-containing protein n=1 Tax=[Myrmecia] bisecta TaxID=41462 RepID=A0AAW1PN61_9CHLO